MKRVKVICPSCGRRLQGVTVDMIGDIGICPDCRGKFEITTDPVVSVCSTSQQAASPANEEICMPPEDVIGDTQAHPSGSMAKKCPFCAEDIRAEAVKRRYCGSIVSSNTGMFGACNSSGKSQANHSHDLPYRKLIITVIVLVFVVVLCFAMVHKDPSERGDTVDSDALTSWVRDSMEEQVAKDKDYRGLTIGQVALVRESQFKFTGYVEFCYREESEKANVSVTMDGNQRLFMCDPPRALIMRAKEGLLIQKDFERWERQHGR